MSPSEAILVVGARQNNLKDLTLRLPLNELIVVTGVSGSGKSSLAFDTIYAEGQRRYVETFSPYARQFLERMDKPHADRIEGIPPAIAIDQTNPVRTSRSTVGTMTELNDHLKLLFARAARLHCRACGREVRRDHPASIARSLLAEHPDARALLTFETVIPESLSEDEVRALLAGQGYTRIHGRRGNALEVIQDRLRLDATDVARVTEAIETALRVGRGRMAARVVDDSGNASEPQRFSSDLHCAACDLPYVDPTPSTFSFNSPIGACETCRGFGRTMGIDLGLVIPDESKSLAQGAIRPWQSESYKEIQDDLVRYARKRGVPVDVPWRDLDATQRAWVIDGEGSWDDKRWYGLNRFFAWLEGRSYRMHVRVLLSRYRSYTPCTSCGGARLKPDGLLWRVGSAANASAAVSSEVRFRPIGSKLTREQITTLPGLTIHDVMLLPIERCCAFFRDLELPALADEATDLLLREIRSRLGYLLEVGLGYLTLDRQSRTLSGGEVQRINLTTALGTSLVHCLFVLDEPSIGLHPRDVGRLIGVLHRLRDAGNSLLVVEHDAQVMRAADRVLDMGPGPGERGGEAVFFGTPVEMEASAASLTGQYLRGEKRVVPEEITAQRPPHTLGATTLEIRGAGAHNLKRVSVAIPLGRLVCITGVSGSGKSTLVRDVLYNGLRKLWGQPTDAPGEHDEIRGFEQLSQVVFVDQSPIGKTARSNPASYVGALDGVRKLLAVEPLSVERGYTAGTFSFNSGTGRCPTCTGSGFEHVEMQFLSDVYLRCPDCDGKRYRAEVLEVKLRPPGWRGAGKSIAEVLEMTVSEAVVFFAGCKEVLRALAPLDAVGLGYLRLGQPVPTLSGGEAQRLKLAGHLGGVHGDSSALGTLFLFDEPTTGLHFEDIARLLSAFRQLQAAGHSLVVIEHNLDVIRAADWLIDLGPEGGHAGGELVCAGTPEQVMECASSHTGAALRAPDVAASRPTPAPRPRAASAVAEIQIHNAREHNLRIDELRIPREKLTVITGVSGSGKSTLAFDILFAEGQRRYLESLNAYARQFVQPATRPEADAILGLPPTVAIEQRTSRGGRKSTVATLTELYHFLRLLFVKLGTQQCPDCELAIEPQSADAIAARIAREYRGSHVQLLAPLVVSRKGYYTDLAQWAAAKGFESLRVDGERLPTRPWPRLDRFKEHDIDLPLGEVHVTPANEAALRDGLARALDFGHGAVRVSPRAGGRGAKRGDALFSTKRACPSCGRSFPELDPRLFSFNSKHGWCEKCFGTGLKLTGFDAEQTGEESTWTEETGGEDACTACEGRRLRPEALAVRFHGNAITDLTRLSVAQAEAVLGKLSLDGRESQIARDILVELRARLSFLREVGLTYLSLDRAAPTLSGGEAQRLRLAAQLGSNLRGVCYVLDEPTIGLHPRDNARLLQALEKLRRKGNTVVVVEHDEETIRRAEHVVDLGPGGGTNGGRVVAQGTFDELLRNPASTTGQCLASPLRHPMGARREAATAIEVIGADLHNLHRVRARFPLGNLVCVTGVSGSGKSTLVRDVLYDNLRRLLAAKGPGRKRGAPPKLRGCSDLRGSEHVSRILEVDQTPIGKTPRSCPATYVGFFDDIRKLFAATAEARMRGWGPARFSFNVQGGRCEECQGQGVQRVELSFLPDVEVSCDACRGARFTSETCSVRFKERSIAEVLALSVDEAVTFFAAHRSIHHSLQLLQEVGLGYLTLGQRSPTLSGGEAQRIKLVTELARIGPARDSLAPPRGRASVPQHALYVLDEPTIGLHMADVAKLIRVLHRLVDAGNTVVIVEHDLDVIAESDWLIDLGPEGGEDGGRVVGQGTPEDVAKLRKDSHTADFLRRFLRARKPEKKA